jgi:hypothetical protein
MNNTVFNQKIFYKTRTQVFELVSIIWLDDYHDNYIDAIKNLNESIKMKNFPNNVFTKDGVIRFLRDSKGLANYIGKLIYKLFRCD